MRRRSLLGTVNIEDNSALTRHDLTARQEESETNLGSRQHNLARNENEQNDFWLDHTVYKTGEELTNARAREREEVHVSTSFTNQGKGQRKNTNLWLVRTEMLRS